MAELIPAHTDDVASRMIFHGAIDSITDNDDRILDIPGIESLATVLGFVFFAARHDPTLKFVRLDTL